MSFLTKPQNLWMYLYFQQGQQIIQNCGFYLPSGAQFTPITVRKLHTVANAEENIIFNTHCSQSYPVTLKNVVLTAQQVN